MVHVRSIASWYSAHAQRKVAPNFEPMLLWCRPHPSLQPKSSCSNSPCNGDILTLLERRIYHKTMTKNRPHLSLRSRLGGLPSRPVEMSGTLRHSLKLDHENASLWPIGPGNLVCAHGTTILTNYEPSKLVEECIFYAFQVRTQTLRKMSV